MNWSCGYIEATKEKLALARHCFQNFPFVTQQFNLYQKTIAKWCSRCLHTCYGTILNLSHHEGHLQDRIAEGILQTLIEVGPKVVEDPKIMNYLTLCGVVRWR
jgi:NADP-dependent alcohol dehydrogenase